MTTKINSKLAKIFASRTGLWEQFIEEHTIKNVLYYPSADEDFLCIEHTHLDTVHRNGLNAGLSYDTPDLYIFSDYYPHHKTAFIDHGGVNLGNHRMIGIEEITELQINPNEFEVKLNPKYKDFTPNPKYFGRAFYFKMVFHSLGNHANTYFIHGIYLFAENINVIDQLFLRHKLPLSHLIWKRDGTALGCGNVSLEFLNPVSKLLNTRWFFIWNEYQGSSRFSHYYDVENTTHYPEEIKPHINKKIRVNLDRIGGFRWDNTDIVNLYLAKPIILTQQD
jgi:hypothetical protein